MYKPGFVSILIWIALQLFASTLMGFALSVSNDETGTYQGCNTCLISQGEQHVA